MYFLSFVRLPLGRLTQEDLEFEDTLDNSVSPCFKTNKKECGCSSEHLCLNLCTAQPNQTKQGQRQTEGERRERTETGDQEIPTPSQ